MIHHQNTTFTGTAMVSSFWFEDLANQAVSFFQKGYMDLYRGDIKYRLDENGLRKYKKAKRRSQKSESSNNNIDIRNYFPKKMAELTFVFEFLENHNKNPNTEEALRD